MCYILLCSRFKASAFKLKATFFNTSSNEKKAKTRKRKRRERKRERKRKKKTEREENKTSSYIYCTVFYMDWYSLFLVWNACMEQNRTEQNRTEPNRTKPHTIAKDVQLKVRDTSELWVRCDLYEETSVF